MLFFFQAEDGIRDLYVTGVQTCALPILWEPKAGPSLSTTVRYIGKQYEDDRQTDVLPDVWTVDAVARMPVGKHFAIVARAERSEERRVGKEWRARGAP